MRPIFCSSSCWIVDGAIALRIFFHRRAQHIRHRGLDRPIATEMTFLFGHFRCFPFFPADPRTTLRTGLACANPFSSLPRRARQFQSRAPRSSTPRPRSPNPPSNPPSVAVSMKLLPKLLLTSPSSILPQTTPLLQAFFPAPPSVTEMAVHRPPHSQSTLSHPAHFQLPPARSLPQFPPTAPAGAWLLQRRLNLNPCVTSSLLVPPPLQASPKSVSWSCLTNLQAYIPRQSRLTTSCIQSLPDENVRRSRAFRKRRRQISTCPNSSRV